MGKWGEEKASRPFQDGFVGVVTTALLPRPICISVSIPFFKSQPHLKSENMELKSNKKEKRLTSPSLYAQK